MTMRSNFMSVLGALALSVMLAVPTADAQLVNPFGKTEAGLIDEGDLDQVRGSIRTVLQAYKVGATQEWHSAKTSRSGVAIMPPGVSGLTVMIAVVLPPSAQT